LNKPPLADLISPQFGKLNDIGSRWESQRQMSPLPTKAIHDLLEQAIAQVLGSKNKHLVIFIDDLDRCNPEAALRLLEGIKVYLNLKNCIVVFGMDQRQIEIALRKALALDKDDEHANSHQAREYLEKICQDIFHLPVPGQIAKTGYFINRLQALDPNDATPWTEYVNDLKAILDDYDCLPANPRKIKALVNRTAVVLRHVVLPDTAAGNPDATKRHYSLLIAIVIIYSFHRRLYEQLDKNPTYITETIDYATTDDDPNILKEDPRFGPMQDIIPSMRGSQALPVNPSDSNVFRLHTLFSALSSVGQDEVRLFLNEGDDA
ncbi:MAG: P-loop NTPase fold protein, partial [Pseudomonadota bacterium]